MRNATERHDRTQTILPTEVIISSKNLQTNYKLYVNKRVRDAFYRTQNTICMSCALFRLFIYHCSSNTRVVPYSFRRTHDGPLYQTCMGDVWSPDIVVAAGSLTESTRFHAGGVVHCVPKETIARHI